MYHILIVDEEEHLLWALERNLFPNRDDIEVHTADTGEEGLEVLERESIELLISDIKMPGQVDGFQLILRAKEKVPDARVMIITAFGTHRIENFAERIGISHYIEKPFTVDELRNAVLEILDEKEGFQGVLSDLELTDIIQMLCLAKRTALLHLKHRDHRGRIVFEAGDVVHAEFDGIVGADAVYEMLALRQGDIFMQSDFDSVERTIDIGWQDLLLEGVKRTDEQRLEDERERTRRKREEDKKAAGDEAADGGSEASGRTKTPIGMGAPSVAADADDDAGDQASDDVEEGAMLFSQEELQEISKASEAALEGEVASEASEDDEVAPKEQEDTVEEELEDRGPGDAIEVGAAEQPSTDAVEGDAGVPEPEQGVGFEQPPEERPMSPEDEGGVAVEASVADEEGGETLKTGTAFEGMGVIDSPAFHSGGGDTAANGSPSASVADEHRAPGTVVADDATDEEKSGGRERSGTSPGMAAVTSGSESSEGSGEHEIFAAPALNGESGDTAVVQRESSFGGAEHADEGGAVPTSDDEDVTASLREFVRECPGLKATALVKKTTGTATEIIHLAGGNEIDRARMASSISNLVSRAERSVTVLDDGDKLREMQLVLPEAYLLLRTLDDSETVHVALVDRDVSLGIALVLMRQFEAT